MPFTFDHPRDADPQYEALAAFAEGRLSEEERTSAIDHVASCGQCRAIVAELARGRASAQSQAVPGVHGSESHTSAEPSGPSSSGGEVRPEQPAVRQVQDDDGGSRRGANAQRPHATDARPHPAADARRKQAEVRELPSPRPALVRSLPLAASIAVAVAAGGIYYLVAPRTTGPRAPVVDTAPSSSPRAPGSPPSGVTPPPSSAAPPTTSTPPGTPAPPTTPPGTTAPGSADRPAAPTTPQIRVPQPTVPAQPPDTTRAAGTRSVAGHTFRLVAGEWIDTAYREIDGLPAVDVTSADALTATPALTPFRPLGRRFTVVVDGTVYRVGLSR